jgi:hypothetical protein
MLSTGSAENDFRRTSSRDIKTAVLTIAERKFFLNKISYFANKFEISGGQKIF